ncbi:helix-turn-helix transcriptional regulator [Fodinicurvata sediminis]|uniref:helix-turn-helix transcriptional regulator n=1 Tax=Fodinicurvata sediminis TaxID=1121832 RepID=UPI0003B56D9D|nr:LuxR C-terminal-related transcriptional regulator [Fodinicurvata sediminis]
MEIDPTTVSRLVELQRNFLQLDLEEDRVRDMLGEIAELVGADTAFAGWVDDGQPWLVTWNTGPQFVPFLQENLAGVDRDGNIRSRDPDLDRLNRRRRQLGSGVYNEQALAPREEIEQTAYFRNGFAPAGMPHVIGMTARLAVGEAIFAFGFIEPDSPGFISGRTETLLSFLLPAFEAGFQAIDRKNMHHARLQQLIDNSSLPARIIGAEDPPDPEALLQLPLPELGGQGGDPHLSIQKIRPEQMALLLARNFGLTQRQQEVCALVLGGHSTSSIAEMLGIRNNTARRHCEAVLQKCGITRREQLANLAMENFSIPTPVTPRP